MRYNIIVTDETGKEVGAPNDFFIDKTTPIWAIKQICSRNFRSVGQHLQQSLGLGNLDGIIRPELLDEEQQRVLSEHLNKNESIK